MLFNGFKFQIFITCCVSLWLHCFLLNIFLILLTKRKKKYWIFQENVTLSRMCFRTLKSQKTAQGHLVPSPPMGNTLKECVIPWWQVGKRRAKRHILNLTLFLFFLWFTLTRKHNYNRSHNYNSSHSVKKILWIRSR